MPSPLLMATLLALLCGPLLYVLARSRPPLLAFLDGFVLVSICGLVLLDVVPDALRSGGYASLGFLLLGLLGPTLLEHLLTRARREAHLAALALAVAGLVVHALGDGAALSPAGDADGSLALAVAVHSVPVGLVVWWLIFPVFGWRLPTLALLAMCAGTLAGYGYGIELSSVLGERAWAWLQALIAGSILHVVFGRPHLEEDAGQLRAVPPFEGLGNLAALGALLLLGGLHGGAEEPSGFVSRLLGLALESAPALLAAYLIGGFISGELPASWLRWLGRGGPGSQALRGMAVGLPLPICSCGVLPVYRSLVQRGIPLAAGLAFLIATPEIGLTALFVSLPLLGVELTLLRIGSAALLAVAVAWLLARSLRPVVQMAPAATCCAHSHAPPAPSRRQRLRRALHSGLVELVDGTAPWILAGLVIAALAAPYAEAVVWADWPDSAQVLLFALIGMPVYVCAAGATPLVAVLIAAGVSPGAAIAFLLTGPATNLATFGVLRQLHGPGLSLGFALVTALGAVLIGLGINALLPAATLAGLTPGHGETAAPWQQASLLLLGLLFGASLLRKGGRAFLAELFETGGGPAPAHAPH
jgi:uncharacterized protein